MKKASSIALDAMRPAMFTRLRISVIKYMPHISGSLLSILFLYAAYNKVAIYSTFVKQLNTSFIVRLFPLKWELPMAYALSILVPALEIIIPVMFVFKRSRLAAFYASFFLMLLFTAYVYVVPHFSIIHACSCGGIISGFSWKDHFIFNCSFLFLSALGLMTYTMTKIKPKNIVAQQWEKTDAHTSSVNH